MDVSMNTSTAIAQQSSGSEAGLAVLKRAIDTEAQSQLALIDAIPKPANPGSANLPPHLGQNINTTA